jgi:general secretion pathway protein D
MITRQFLKTLTTALFLTLCFSISAFAQSQPEPQDPTEKNRTDVNFNSPVKAAIDVLGRQIGLNIVFDDAIKNGKLTIALKDVTVEQALKIIFLAKNFQARIIEEKKIIVFPDNEANTQKYSQYELWPQKRT